MIGNLSGENGKKDVISALQHSAGLVKGWGQSSLPDGQTLAQAFTFRGLPLWDAIGPELAAWLIPRALSRGERTASVWQLVRPYLSLVKHEALLFAALRAGSRGCAQWPDEAVCLFLGFSPYMYRDVLKPVIARLEEQHIQTVSMYDRMPLKPDRGLLAHSIWQHMSPQVVKEIGAQRREFRAWVKRSGISNTLAQIIGNDNQVLWHQSRDLFRSLFIVRLPQLVAHAVIARHILETHRPALIVSVDVSDPRSRLYEVLGREFGIPSLEVQFGFAGQNGVEWQFFVADQLAVRSNKWYEALLEHGLPPEKMIITGSPTYDDQVSESSESVTQMRERLGIPKEHKIAVFASFWNHITNEEWTKSDRLKQAKQMVFEASSRVSGLTLIVKPHPCENVAETKQLAHGFHNILFVSLQEDIRDLVKACDVFVSFGSSTIERALVARKPVIYPFFADLLWWDRDDIFLESGAVFEAQSVYELVHRLKAVVDGSVSQAIDALEPARQRFLEEWMYSADGQAAGRIAALAVEMMKTSGCER
jgi:CDP-glycerol glycerophosphotransferase (TagB/SpsB family)